MLQAPFFSLRLRFFDTLSLSLHNLFIIPVILIFCMWFVFAFAFALGIPLYLLGNSLHNFLKFFMLFACLFTNICMLTTVPKFVYP